MDYSSILATNSGVGQDTLNTLGANWGISTTAVLIIIFVLMVWELVWKLIAMWKASKRSSVVWFIVLALFNTIGILPILYIFVFSKLGKKNKEAKTETKANSKVKK